MAKYKFQLTKEAPADVTLFIPLKTGQSTFYQGEVYETNHDEDAARLMQDIKFSVQTPTPAVEVTETEEEKSESVETTEEDSSSKPNRRRGNN